MSKKVVEMLDHRKTKGAVSIPGAPHLSSSVSGFPSCRPSPTRPNLGPDTPESQRQEVQCKDSSKCLTGSTNTGSLSTSSGSGILDTYTGINLYP